MQASDSWNKRFDQAVKTFDLDYNKNESCA